MKQSLPRPDDDRVGASAYHAPTYLSDLYSRVNVGTKVIVLPMTERRAELR